MPNHYLKQRDNGTWYIHWTDADRRPQKSSTGTKDKGEAQKELDRFLTGEAEPRDGPAVTVAMAWAVYWDKQVRGGKSEKSIATCWNNLKPFFGACLVSEVRGLVEDYTKLRRNGAGGLGTGKAKDGTIRKELVYLLAALNFCSDPYYGIDLFKPELIGPILRLFPKESLPRDRWLREHEVDALHAAAAGMRKDPARLSRLELFLWLALETAGRVTALLELTWERVDWEMGSIDLLVPGERQTSKYRPTVKISKALMPVLQRAYRERQDIRPGARLLGHKGPVWESVQRCVANAGLSAPIVNNWVVKSGISPHTFRHTAATMMARRGVPLFTIAKILGNSARMVEQVYAKFQVADQQDAVDAISSSRLAPSEVKRPVQLRTV